MLDILCIGDAVIDIFLKIPENSPLFGLDKERNKLLISFGEKINVEKYTLSVGGNAANTSIGISRLGFNVGIAAEIGKDEFSQKILRKLKDENVNTDLLLQTETEKTSFSVVINYNAERTIFSEHVKRDHEFNFEDISTKFVYLTSLGNIWEKAYEKTLGFVQKNNIKLAFNPGTLQLEKRDKLIMDIVEQTDYLFVNKEEAEELLYGKELDANITNSKSLIKKLLFGLKSLGAKNVIITDSTNGSYCQTEENEIYCLGIVGLDGIEKTGAGDAYTSGFISAILNGLGIKDAMIWGSINSFYVIQKIGAEDGLATKEQLNEKVKSLRDFYPMAF